MPTMSEDQLEKALEKLCQKLIDKEKGGMQGHEKHAIAVVKDALIKAYGADGVPQDLFTDPAKQKTLLIGLISVPLMEKNPALKFDMALFFTDKLHLSEAKTFFKAFLTHLNKLEPSNRRRSEKEIEAAVEALLEKMEQERQEKLEENESFRLVDSPSASDALDDIFETLFGINRFGVLVPLPVNKGNQAGFIDSYSAANARGGSIHEGRGLAGDSTTDPYVTAMAKERLLDLGGLSAEVLRDLKHDGIIYTTPTLKMPGAI